MKHIRRLSPNAAYLLVLVLLSVVLWLPRLRGPLDLRWDGAVYYILGTSLAEGKGYRLLNEPGEIEAIWYPPLLPLFAAGIQVLAGSTEPAVAGHWLRLSFFVLFVACVIAVYMLTRRYLSPGFAFLSGLVWLLHVHTMWLSDLFYAELPFALASILFLHVSHWRESQSREWLAGLLVATAYLLRTSGIALLTAWVGESLVRRRFREMAFRVALALVPVLGWQGYVAHVKAGTEYALPAYAYQRAGYNFYNVEYLENFAYVDPFAPELGMVSPELLAARIGRNLVSMPVSLGMAVSSNPQWAKSKLTEINEGFRAVQVPVWLVDVPFVLLGAVVPCGLVLLILRGEWLIPLYVGGSVVLICLTQFPSQFERYLAPLTSLLAIALFVAFVAARERLSVVGYVRWRFAGVALIAMVTLGIFVMQLALLYKTYEKSRRVYYEDDSGRRGEYRLFFYAPAWPPHDEALEWLKEVAKPGEIVATSTPPWAYLKTGLRAVLPPFEPDVREAQRLIDSVPVQYLIIDKIPFPDVTQRYAAPVVQAFPEHWALMYSTGDGRSQIYRRVTRGRSTVASEQLGTSYEER